MSITVNGVVLSDRTVAYLETILWAETVSLPCEESALVDGCMDVDEDHELAGISECEPLEDHFDLDDFDAESLRKAESDCNDFFDYLDREGLYDRAIRFGDDERIAYDFWLNRNGHGAGFWDGDYADDTDDVGDALSDAAHTFGSCDVYVGDDCKLHLC